MQKIDDLKEILIKINNNLPSLDEFFEILMKESENKLTFTKFKKIFEDKYPSISRVDKIILLKSLSFEKDLSIDIILLFMHWEKLLNTIITSSSLCLYKISYLIEKHKKITVKEFIYSVKLTMNENLDINKFYNILSSELKLPDIVIKIAFKALDINKNGLVSVEHFCLVIASFRADNKSNKKETDKIKYDINNLEFSCFSMNKILRENFISDIFIKTINKDFTSDIYELIGVMQKIQTNNSEESLYDLLTNSGVEIMSILGYLMRDDKRIYKIDFDKLMLLNKETTEYLNAQIIVKYQDKNSNNIEEEYKEVVDKLKERLYSKEFFNNFFVNNKKQNILKYSKFTISESQRFWLNKFNLLLNEMSITSKMIYSTTISDSLANNNSITIKSTVMNLDILKKKLKIFLPVSKISASEINNIVDSLDINKNRTISEEDFIGIMNDCNMEINEDASMIKIANISDLPIKGNYKVLSKINSDLHNAEQKQSNDKFVKAKNKQKFIQPEINLNIKNLKDVKKEETKEEANAINSSHTFIKSFLNEIDLFEQGEWSFIEILEDTSLHNKSNFITTSELFILLLQKYYPTITRDLIYSIVKTLDHNMDGVITFHDMINFLLDNFHHKSSKLAIKQICYHIEILNKQSIENYFTRVYSEISYKLTFIEFLKLFNDNFNIPASVIKKIYYEITELINRQISISDLIDVISEYSYYSSAIGKNNSNKTENTIELIDKKYFENKMVEFVCSLIKAFPIENGSLSNSLNTYLILSNLDSFELSIFREKIIKGLNIEFSFGIALFQMLKGLSGKGSISKKDLLSVIDSYIPKDISKIGNYDLKIIVYYMELNGPFIKHCLESLICSERLISVVE